jgi:hypothetical protein
VANLFLFYKALFSFFPDWNVYKYIFDLIFSNLPLAPTHAIAKKMSENDVISMNPKLIEQF